MDKKIELDFVEYRGIKYPHRAIVIFGQTEVCVADVTLGEAMCVGGIIGDICTDDETLRTDELFAGYVPVDVLRNYSDDELAAYVEEIHYQNEPTEPNTAMPFDWFDHTIDCCDLTDDDNADEFYYKQGNDGIRVYDSNREWVVTIKGRKLNEPEFHIYGISHWAYKDLDLLDATYAAMGEETHYSKE